MLAFKVRFSKFQISAIIATLIFVIFFVIPVETIVEDRGMGREVEMKKTLIQKLLEPDVDIEIPVNTEEETHDGFQNEFLDDLVRGIYGD